VTTDRPTAITDRALPVDVAAPFQTALGLEERPRTLDDWAEATAAHLAAAGITVGFDEMCLTEASPHEARIGDEVRHFACVLDTLLLPFVVDDLLVVEIRTESPVSDTVIEATATREALSVDEDDAPMSFGVAADVDPPEDRDDPIAHGYSKFCPYVNAFVDRSEYETWADATPEAVTMAFPLAEGFALARYLGSELTE